MPPELYNVESSVYEYVAGQSNWKRAINDLRRGAKRWRLWTNMAIRNFRNQYRGALLGPFWLTVTTAATAIGLGVLYAKLFGRPLEDHLPYVTIAVTIWGLIGNFLTSGASVFTSNAHVFQEYPLPHSLFVYRMTLTQLITFVFKILVVAGVLVAMRTPVTPLWLLAPLGLLLIFWSGFWTSFFLGIVNARFRDFGQLVGASMTFIFFVTPIFWHADRLGEYAWAVNYNPFYHLIETVRSPLLNDPTDLGLHFAVATGIAAVSTILGLSVYGKYSHRLPYWC